MSTPLRALIVEDSEDDTLLLVRALRRGGYAPTSERVETPAAMLSQIGCVTVPSEILEKIDAGEPFFAE